MCVFSTDIIDIYLINYIDNIDIIERERDSKLNAICSQQFVAA